MRKYLYPALVFTFIGLVGAIILFQKSEPIPPLKERQGKIALGAEWLNTKKAIESLQSDLRRDPDNVKAKLTLAQGYIQEARITGNHGYYDKAALQLLQDVLKKEPQNYDAICCKAIVQLSQHHFAEGLETGKTAVKINPYNAYGYGLLCDAYLELGNYPKAVEMADKMVSVRPDLRSYSRVSYLREIHGDNAGAIEAMKLALSAGVPGLEQTEWIRYNLGSLYENTGDLKNAEFQYQMALIERPHYAYAMAGLGRIAKAHKDYPEAIKQFEQANKIITEFAFADELTDLYRLNGQPDKSKESAKNVVKMLGEGAGEEGNEGHGHYADRELVFAYLKLNEPKKALAHAKTEYQRRPENIDACEALAWAHYKNGDYTAAAPLMEKALRTNCQRPVLLARAGLIKIKTGDKTGGLALLQKARSLNPFLDPEFAPENNQFVALY